MLRCFISRHKIIKKRGENITSNKKFLVKEQILVFFFSKCCIVALYCISLWMD